MTDRTDAQEAERLAEVLEQYNAWRRGGDGEQPDPSKLGKEIEAAAILLRRLADPWRPIEEAPKDGTRVLVYPPTWEGSGSCSVASWDEDKYSRRPRPFWKRSDDFGRVTTSRERPPTHFMPLPSAPSTTQEQS